MLLLHDLFPDSQEDGKGVHFLNATGFWPMSSSMTSKVHHEG